MRECPRPHHTHWVFISNFEEELEDILLRVPITAMAVIPNVFNCSSIWISLLARFIPVGQGPQLGSQCQDFFGLIMMTFPRSRRPTMSFPTSSDSRLRARLCLTVVQAASPRPWGGAICFTTRRGICLNVFNILSYIPAPRYIVLPSVASTK